MLKRGVIIGKYCSVGGGSITGASYSVCDGDKHYACEGGTARETEDCNCTSVFIKNNTHIIIGDYKFIIKGG